MAAELWCVYPGCQRNFGSALELRAHGERCPFQLDACPQCRQLIPRRSMAGHISAECPSRVCSCDTCHLELLAKELEAHLLECPEKVVVCTDCGSKAKFKDLAAHRNVCFTQGQCCYGEMGCRFRGPGQALLDHERDATVHLSLLFKCLKDAMDTNKKLAAKNSELIASHNSLARKMKETNSKCEQLRKMLSEVKSELESVKGLQSKTMIPNENPLNITIGLEPKKISSEDFTAKEKEASNEKPLNQSRWLITPDHQPFPKGESHPEGPGTKLSDIISHELTEGYRFVSQVPLPFSSQTAEGKALTKSWNMALGLQEPSSLLTSASYCCDLTQLLKRGKLSLSFSIHKRDTSPWPPAERAFFCFLNSEGEEEEETKVISSHLLQVVRKFSKVKKIERIKFHQKDLPVPSTYSFRSTLLLFKAPETERQEQF